MGRVDVPLQVPLQVPVEVLVPCTFIMSTATVKTLHTTTTGTVETWGPIHKNVVCLLRESGP